MTIENSKYPENKFQDSKYPDVKQPDVKSADTKAEAQRSKNTSEIEAAIAENRAALSADVKALSDKVSPANVKQEVKHVAKQAKEAAFETVTDTAVELKDAAVQKVSDVADAAMDKAVEIKDATVETAHQAADAIGETLEEVGAQSRRFGKSAWRFTVANAVPLGLIGVGAGLLLSNQRRSGTETPPRRALPATQIMPAQRRSAMLDESDYAASAAYPAGGRSPVNGGNGGSRGANVATRKAASKLDDVQEGIAHGARVARDETAHALTTTKRTIKNGAVRSRDFVKQNWERTQRASSELATAHPVALSFGAMLAGIGIGLLLPSTAREDELLQPSRDKFRHALGQARDVAEDVTHMAQDTTNQAVAAFDGTHA
jgi:hypothetical protein